MGFGPEGPAISLVHLLQGQLHQLEKLDVTKLEYWLQPNSVIG